jgi:hypothetical protein
MPRYLIEVPHEPVMGACALAAKSLLQTGTHFVTNAEWGCADGEHKAWIIVEMDSKQDARGILPLNFRPNAKIIELTRFTMQDIDEVVGDHPQ